MGLNDSWRKASSVRIDLFKLAFADVDFICVLLQNYFPREEPCLKAKLEDLSCCASRVPSPTFQGIFMVFVKPEVDVIFLQLSS